MRPSLADRAAVARGPGERHQRLGIWDALVLSAAADAKCRLLLSEDLQDGFTWRGVTVANPFAGDRHPLLRALLGDDVVRRNAAPSPVRRGRTGAKP